MKCPGYAWSCQSLCQWDGCIHLTIPQQTDPCFWHSWYAAEQHQRVTAWARLGVCFCMFSSSNESVSDRLWEFQCIWGESPFAAAFIILGNLQTLTGMGFLFTIFSLIRGQRVISGWDWSSIASRRMRVSRTLIDVTPLGTWELTIIVNNVLRSSMVNMPSSSEVGLFCFAWSAEIVSFDFTSTAF